jgi:hypothetical protein
MANAWLAHVKKTMRSHKGMKFGQVLKMAKKSYKKHRGGEDSDSDNEPSKITVDSSENSNGSTGGRRRRRSTRRTRRHRRR